MIILITGASHSGKTLLAQRMLEKYKYPYLSIDHLKMGLIRSGETALTPLDDDALTDYLWPIVREMVKTAIENRQNLIVEGCYIPFDWRRDFDDRYLPSIRFICLAFPDAYIDKHFAEIKAHASDIESRLDDTSCTIDSLKADNRVFREGFEQSGEQILLIESDFLQTLDGWTTLQRSKTMTDTTDKTLDERMEYAAELKKKMNCCQAVLVAFADRLGKGEDELLRLGSGFGSGMGTMEGTCGALVGAVMVSSLLSEKGEAMKNSRVIMPQFKELCGATICRDLKGVGTGKVLCSCEDCVRNAVRAVATTLDTRVIVGL